MTVGRAAPDNTRLRGWRTICGRCDAYAARPEAAFRPGPGVIQLRLASIKPQIYEVFVITKLNKLFKILPSRDEALASFNQ